MDQTKTETATPNSLSWAGQIPISLTLCPNDITTPTPPQPFYAMCGRMSYLHVACRVAVEEFKSFGVIGLCGGGGGMIVGGDAVGSRSGSGSSSKSYSGDEKSSNNESNQVWFSHNDNDKPLKFNYPIGVLFDMHNLANSASNTNIDTDTDTRSVLPWDVTVHFSAYPSDVIVNHEGVKTEEKAYMNALKQALYLQHSSGKVGQGLNMRDSNRLWSCVVSGDYWGYNKVNASLRAGIESPKIPEEPSTKTDEEIETDAIRSRLSTEKKENERIKSGLPPLIPPAIIKAPPLVVTIPVRVVGVNLKSPIQLTLKQQPNITLTLFDALVHAELSEVEMGSVVINGLRGIPLETSLGEIWSTCQCADHFLYIVTCMKSQ